MPEEETFALRLPDGTKVNWTAQQITEYQGEYHVDLEHIHSGYYFIPSPRMTVDSLLAPPLSVTADGQVIFDEKSLALLDEHIRKVIREELRAMLPEVTRQVLSSLANELRTQIGINGRRGL